jgi:putative FmdB family regulatory protein
MPRYDMKCAKCDFIEEVWRSMNDDKKVECPSCKLGNMDIIISGGSGFNFKGAGFYETDYRMKK